MVDRKKLQPELSSASQTDPSKIEQARPDLNSPPTHNNHVPDMNEGKEDLVSTGAGTLGGAAVGAAFGIAGGPPGAVVGGIIGGIVGGIAGHDIAKPDAKNPEDDYWRDNYRHASYYQENQNLEYERDYSSAYRLGYESRPHYEKGRNFSEVETELEAKWEHFKGESRLTWEQAKLAAKDAWNRVVQ